tara:strand:+ start:1118 stop:1519 length:402 start_codon:yes stop_codon:yes gene_type:complete
VKKLEEILLVDDSEGTNDLNTLLLTEMGVVNKISTALNGKLALDYLTAKDDEGNYPNPDLILLDINMPVMDGYQFLDAYKNLDEEMKADKIIVMLTTSINEIDIEKAKAYGYAKGYHFKPLDEDKMQKILEGI